MKKTFLAIMMSLVCALGVLGLAACDSQDSGISQEFGISDEDAIKQDCQTQMESALSKDVIAAAFRTVDGMDEAEEMGFDVDAVAEVMANLVTVEVTDVTVDGDTGTATVQVTYPDFNDDEMQELIAEKANDIDVESLSSTEDFMKAYQDILIEAFQDESVPTTTEENEIEYEKVDGTWQMVDADEFTEQIEELTGAGASSTSSGN